jgi:hypothetical protein
VVSKNGRFSRLIDESIVRISRTHFPLFLTCFAIITIMRRTSLIIIAIILAVLIVIFTRLELYFPLYPDIDTIYTREFTHEKFAAVKPGMSKNQVRLLLGAPFTPIPYVPHDDRNECWPYSRDGKLGLLGDFAWVFVRVCFKDGKVDGAFKSVFSD